MLPSAHIEIEENRIGAQEFASFIRFFDKEITDS